MGYKVTIHGVDYQEISLDDGWQLDEIRDEVLKYWPDAVIESIATLPNRDEAELCSVFSTGDKGGNEMKTVIEHYEQASGVTISEVMEALSLIPKDARITELSIEDPMPFAETVTLVFRAEREVRAV